MDTGWKTWNRDITMTRNVHSRMQNKLPEYMDINKYTFRKILLELDRVKMICAADR